MADKRIMICGVSGTGKTTLAEHISTVYKLPFISTSAKAIWPKYGFRNHEDAINGAILDKDLGFKYQWDVLRARQKALLEAESYVTDRSFIDNLTYLILQMSHHLCDDDIKQLTTIASEGLAEVDGLIYIKWSGEIVLEDNGKRVTSRIYQEMVDVVMGWVINSYQQTTPKIPLLTLHNWDFETRIKQVDKWLKRL